MNACILSFSHFKKVDRAIPAKSAVKQVNQFGRKKSLISKKT